MDNKKNNRTIVRAIEVLDYIAEKRKACSILELQQALDIPKTSVFDIVHTLGNLGMLYFDIKTRQFSLGIKNYELGMAYLDSMDLHTIVLSYLKELSYKYQQTSYFAIPKGKDILYINKVEGKSPLRLTCTIGNTNDMYSTGLGKAMLAAMPLNKVIDLLKHANFQKKTIYTIDSLNELLIELAKIRERGYSIDNEEDNIGVFCIAAPIMDHCNLVVGAISVSMFKIGEMDNITTKISQDICSMALEISNRIGFKEKKLFF